MSQPFLGQLMLFPFGFAPKGWAQCNGQLLPINQNQALFSLLGTMYGGDGQTTFALPNLRGQTPISFTSAYPQGSNGGEDGHLLTAAEVPQHTHTLICTTDAAGTSTATGHLLGATAAGTGIKAYSNPTDNPNTPLTANTIQQVGGGQKHENRQPFLVLNWCIALQGIYPSRN